MSLCSATQSTFVKAFCRRRAGRNRIGPAIFLACAVHVMNFSSATARNLDIMAEILAPAYRAMNYGLICAQDDSHFLLKTSGPRGTVLNYAEHVKDEVIESLSQEEAALVLTRAADAARSIVREELRRLLPTYPIGREDQIINWCYGAAMSFVRTFIEHHDTQHEVILQELEQARGLNPADGNKKF